MAATTGGGGTVEQDSDGQDSDGQDCDGQDCDEEDCDEQQDGEGAQESEGA